ncbi:MAG: rhodanese-like domain-containing protein [Candidatus Thiodiazotropha sp.]
MALTTFASVISAQDFSTLLNNPTGCDQGDEPGMVKNEVYSPYGINKTDRKVEEFRCLTSPEEVYEARQQGDLWLIDIRSPEEYQEQTIPGAVNVPSFLIKQKIQFKSGHTVLFNDGLRHAELEVLCRQLEERGFHQVSVLKGGVEAWYQAGFPLSGRPLSPSELSASDYMSSLNERAWIIIGLDPSAQVLVDRTGAKEVIEYGHDIKSLLYRIGQRTHSIEPGKETSFLVVSGTGSGYQEARKSLTGRGLREVYYLSDGVEGLRRYLLSNQAQLQRVRQGFKKPDSCSG